MVLETGTRGAVNTFLHHDVAIGPLSHQKKVPTQLWGGDMLNWP